MADQRFTRSIVALLVAVLAACAAQIAPPPSEEARRPADFPDAYYRQLRAQGKPVLQIDPADSLLTIEVLRAGPLARFGHDHVIASHDVAGYIAPNERRADLFLPLDALVVDEPALRAQSGFDTQPSADDIAGTHRNMQEKVLETGRYPFVQVAINGAAAEAGRFALRASVNLHGMTQIVEPVIQIIGSPDALEVTGAFSIDQSQFGISPFSILGGAIAVQDRVQITFRLHALRLR